MGGVVARKCPNCGAPVPTQQTLLTCEFCKAPLAVVRPPPPPQAPSAPVPVAPFGGVRQTASRRASAPVAIGAVLALVIIGASAVAMVVLVPAREPPMPAMPMPDLDPTGGTGGPGGGGGSVNVTGAGLIAMFETQCAAGDAQSCITAGTLYEHGQMGVSVDRAKARSYYQRACRLGNAAGCSMANQL